MQPDFEVFIQANGVAREVREAAILLEEREIAAGVINLRTVAPLDEKTVCEVFDRTGRMLVLDENYCGFGLAGELAAVVLEAGMPSKYGRVCTEGTIPYA